MISVVRDWNPQFNSLTFRISDDDDDDDADAATVYSSLFYYSLFRDNNNDSALEREKKETKCRNGFDDDRSPTHVHVFDTP